MIAGQYLVTTSHHASAQIVHEAKVFARLHRLTYIPRSLSLDTIALNQFNSGIFVITGQGIAFFKDGKTLTYHSNMAKLRIMSIQQGHADRMVVAMELRKGDQLIDCTLGLGADALVASYVAGRKGHIIGLESSWPVCHLTQYGLSHLRNAHWLNDDVAPIQVYCTNHMDYLSLCPDKSADVVYFDPMFRTHLEASYGLNTIREIANMSSVSQVSIQHAIRVARRRVVLKERTNSDEFQRLGFNMIPSTRGAKTQYGFIQISNAT